jgi:hypothetical protein
MKIYNAAVLLLLFVEIGLKLLDDPFCYTDGWQFADLTVAVVVNIIA